MADTSIIIDSGFYDSINRDRLYSADQMNMPYKDLITEGVYGSIAGSESTAFAVAPGIGLVVYVNAGRALLGGRWVSMESVATINVPSNTGNSARIDSVILRVDTNTSERNASLIYRVGSAIAPSLVTTEGITETRIADITVGSGATAIAASGIADKRTFASLVIANDQLVAVLTKLMEDHPELIATIPDGSVTSEKLANYAVTEEKLALEAVGSAQLADSAVNADKIKSGNVKAVHLDSSIHIYRIGTDNNGKITFKTGTHSSNPVYVPMVFEGYTAEKLDTMLAEKANIDGYYEEMTVGDAEQLVSTQYVEDADPYKFRPTALSKDVGNRLYLDKITGGSLPWNQLNDNSGGTSTNFGVTFTKNANGSWTANGTSTGYAQIAVSANARIPITAGHKILVTAGGENLNTHIWGNGANTHIISTAQDTVFEVPSDIQNLAFYIDVSNGKTVENVTFFPQLFDLTAMFGTAIADYIYSLEQSTAGAGVQWFRKYFPNDYYPYNAGEMLHVAGLSSHDTIGFNQWDEEWELGTINFSTGENASSSSTIRSKNYIDIIANTEYRVTAPKVIYVFYYDSNKDFILVGGVNNTITRSPSNARYMRFAMEATTYDHDICINLSWSGTRNGEYEPYIKHSYALDDSLTLRGIPKIDSNGNLYYDGDEYAYDGTVTRRYGIVDLGTLTYSNNGATSTVQQFVTFLDGKAFGANNFVCTKFIAGPSAELGMASGRGTNNAIVFNTTLGTTAEAFKSAMSGVYLVYELATPTTETAEPYNEVQIVDDWGTEEFVSTTIVPIGHETRFPQNLRDKLQHLPNLASADGDYAIRQTGSQMALVPLQDVKELPTVPTTDGTYGLKVTVSNGTATLSWVTE